MTSLLFDDDLLQAEAMYQYAISRPLPEKIAQSIALIRQFETAALRLSPAGYYVAFSGGKDSQVLAKLFEMSGVRYELWYSNTTIDPPELIYFMRHHYPQVRWNNPKVPMMKRLPEQPNGAPTRLIRWCCEIYKEQGGKGTVKAIGVRAQESPRRKGLWRLVSTHRTEKTPVLSPILYWSESDVWAFIRDNSMPYCELYDQGFRRIGCIGCPMSGPKGIRKEFDRYPRYEAAWKRALFAYWERWHGVPRNDGGERHITSYPTPQSYWDWWISGKAFNGGDADCQLYLW